METPDNILITGAEGQLGSEFCRVLSSRHLNYSAPAETEFDITRQDTIAGIIDRVSPSVLINCAAYNNVNEAEKQAEKTEEGDN